MEIPSFNGENLKWTEFLDSFEASIHENSTLSDIEKLSYLMSKLTGEAKSSVSGILLSNENYAVTVELLKERYGDTQAVVSSHYTELINLKSALNTPKGLRSLYNQIEKHLTSLKALEQDINQDIFISMITSKLPKDVLFQLEVQKGARAKLTVNELRERLNDYVAARERAEQNACAVKTEESENLHKPRIHVSSAEALVAGVQVTDNKRERKKFHPRCRYCEETHWSDECTTYRTVEARKQKIKGSCYLCLNQSHQAGSCHQRIKCVYCGQVKHHHRSLCRNSLGQHIEKTQTLLKRCQYRMK